jgi:hypothetical protein
LDSSEQGCDAFGRSKSTPTADESLPSIGPMFDDTTTCEPSPAKDSSEPMLSVEGFRAKTSALRNTTARDLKASEAVYGLSLRGSFAFYDQQSLSWKTSQACLFGGLIAFSETWPNAGTMRNGAVTRRAPWVRHTCDEGCSLWATPRKSRRGVTKDKGRPGGGCRCLETDIANRGHIGPVNPTWVEWLMGFPAHWTDLAPSETPSSPKSLNGSAVV